jgi:hypothetical protein
MLAMTVQQQRQMQLPLLQLWLQQQWQQLMGLLIQHMQGWLLCRWWVWMAQLYRRPMLLLRLLLRLLAMCSS